MTLCRPHGCAVLAYWLFTIGVGAAEIVLCACAADGGIPCAVKVELDFAPPHQPLIVDAPEHIGADIMTLAPHIVKDGVNLAEQGFTLRN